MHLHEGEAGTGASDASTTAFHLVCFATLVVLTLTERFVELPGAAAALASSWYLLRH